jgi:hypothetical protein
MVLEARLSFPAFQVSMLRRSLAVILENEEQWVEAAVVLSAIPMDSVHRFFFSFEAKTETSLSSSKPFPFPLLNEVDLLFCFIYILRDFFFHSRYFFFMYSFVFFARRHFSLFFMFMLFL